MVMGIAKACLGLCKVTLCQQQLTLYQQLQRCHLCGKWTCRNTGLCPGQVRLSFIQASGKHGQAREAYLRLCHSLSLAQLLHTSLGFTIADACLYRPTLLAIDLTNAQQCSTLNEFILELVCQRSCFIVGLDGSR